MAQTEVEEDSVPVVVSGTLDCLDSQASGDDEPIGQSTVTVHAWQADDTRLTGEVNYGGRWQLYEEPAEDAGDPGDGPGSGRLRDRQRWWQLAV